MGENSICITKESLDSIRRMRDDLKVISDNRLASWVRFGQRDAADEFASYVRRTKMHGNPMRFVTGETDASIKSGTMKRGLFKGMTIVRPGFGIDGCLNYLNKWVGTNLEFMRPASDEFNAMNRVEQIQKMNIDKMLEKVSREMSK